MNLKLKNIVTVFMLAGIIVPFVFITDFFPFLRFGMFAEPITSSKQTERFLIYTTDSTGIRKMLDPKTIGIHENTFHYLLRNYYYRKENDIFLNKISHITGEKYSELAIIKISMNQHLIDYDTVVVSKYIP